MTPEGLAVFNQRKDQVGYSAAQRNAELSKDYLDEFYNQLTPSFYLVGNECKKERDST